MRDEFIRFRNYTKIASRYGFAAGASREAFKLIYLNVLNNEINFILNKGVN